MPQCTDVGRAWRRASAVVGSAAVRTAQITSRSSTLRPARFAPRSSSSSARCTMPRLLPTSSSTPSATSPATSIALGPEAAISTGMRRPARVAQAPRGLAERALSPASRVLIGGDGLAHLGERGRLPPDRGGRRVAGAHHELHPPRRQLLHRLDRAGQHRGVAGERVGDRREELHPRGMGRGLAERDEGVARDHLAVEDAGAVEARRLDRLDQAHQLGHGRGARHPDVDANRRGHGDSSLGGPAFVIRSGAAASRGTRPRPP